ncbi:hypothetical protein DFJ67_3520 [Asanoa ferruginea]|uniref:Type ISP restriction-modification enzyme LLaBIII C-terminal specificity domain-containing protein n=1 Tax=Asanoa ferruginea TaxID=53367 RepID=A0A3D9ZKY3_9ACTN|nr:hypothetical protein DFJ67_3520 [Asanoa ferruginea]
MDLSDLIRTSSRPVGVARRLGLIATPGTCRASRTGLGRHRPRAGPNCNPTLAPYDEPLELNPTPPPWAGLIATATQNVTASTALRTEAAVSLSSCLTCQAARTPSLNLPKKSMPSCLSPGTLVGELARAHRRTPAPGDLFAYVAGIVSHPGYTRRFLHELEQLGIRVPLTSDAKLWQQAVAVGHNVLWLHTFGCCTADGKTARPSFRDFVDAFGPKVIAEIPDTHGDLPDVIDHDPETDTLIIGRGRLHTRSASPRGATTSEVCASSAIGLTTATPTNATEDGRPHSTTTTPHPGPLISPTNYSRSSPCSTNPSRSNHVKTTSSTGSAADH